MLSVLKRWISGDDSPPELPSTVPSSVPMLDAQAVGLDLASVDLDSRGGVRLMLENGRRWEGSHLSCDRWDVQGMDGFSVLVTDDTSYLVKQVDFRSGASAKPINWDLEYAKLQEESVEQDGTTYEEHILTDDNIHVTMMHSEDEWSQAIGIWAHNEGDAGYDRYIIQIVADGFVERLAGIATEVPLDMAGRNI